MIPQLNLQQCSLYYDAVNWTTLTAPDNVTSEWTETLTMQNSGVTHHQQCQEWSGTEHQTCISSGGTFNDYAQFLDAYNNQAQPQQEDEYLQTAQQAIPTQTRKPPLQPRRLQGHTPFNRGNYAK